MDKTQINKPIGPGKTAKVPVIMQLEALECGAAALAMVLAYYGRYVPLSQLRKECGVSRDGSTMKSIFLVGQSYGLEAHAYRYDADELKTEVTYPCILFWKHKHFLVLDGYKKGKFIVNDPGAGLVSIPEEEFVQSYSNLCLTLVPTEKFTPGGERDSVWNFIRQRLKGTGPMIALVIITTLILAVLGIVEPVFPRLFIDNLLPGKLPVQWRTIFFAAFIFVALARIIVSWIKNSYLLKMQGKTAIYASSSFIWKMLRLPMDFFSQRLPGDLVNRSQSNQRITAALILQFAPLALDFAAMVFYLLLMIQYSFVLAMFGVVSVALNILISLFIAKKSRNLMKIQKKNDGQLVNTGMSGMYMIETIKSAGAEDSYFENWAGVYAAANDNKVKLINIQSFYGQIPCLVSALTDAIVLCVSVGFIIAGDWTMGLVVAFSGLLDAFSDPASNLVDAIHSFQDIRTDIERIDDVMQYETDVPEELEIYSPDETYEKLTGKLEFKNITFGYNRLQPALIKDFNLKVEPGSSIALVGGSGSGKSTVAKLVSGLNKPWEGEILFDGKPINEIKRSIFTASVSSVDQEISLFADTITNNISMWDSSISEDAVIAAAKDAQIYEDIMVRENGFSTKMFEGGRDFSGGQRQRIEIARALASEPSIVILDEATSALDAETEFETMKAIRARDITTVIISHRLSTVRDCDEIIVLDGGTVVDRGRHEELMERCEYYKTMIINE